MLEINSIFYCNRLQELKEFTYLCPTFQSFFSTMGKEITIYDIAKELNLSASTVSRALKENPVINIETRKRVLDCAKELGYRSNTFASNLRTQRTNTIGVIIPRLDSNFMSACLAVSASADKSAI